MRLISIFVLQLIGSLGVVGLGVWGVAHPVNLQRFLNDNFALLPAVERRSIVTSTLIRVAGIGLILLGSIHLRSFRDEIAAFFGFGPFSR